MGCASSKADDLPLVALCRERRELIRAAADHRYVLAAAHASYFRALDRVGEALHRFAAEELVEAPASPVLTLPPSDGKPSRSKSGGSSTVKGENASDTVASSLPSPSSSSVSRFSGSHLDEECHHLNDPLGSESEESFERRNGGGGGEGWNSFPHSFPFPAFPNANYYYMKAAPTIPSTVYQDPHSEKWYNAQGQRFGFGYGYGYGYPSFVQSGGYFYEPPGMSRKNEAPAATSSEEPPPPQPPPPPPSHVSSWDFFNPFDSYEQMFDVYAKSRFGLGSVVSSPNSSEVREQEGIPDLEEETEQEYVKDTGKRSILREKRVVDDDSDRFNSSVGSSEAVAAPHVDEKISAVIPEEREENKIRFDGRNLKNSKEVEEKDARNERLRFEEGAEAVLMEDSGLSRNAVLLVERTKNVVEAVRDITEQFKSAASCGDDVSRLLEVGKIQYRQRIRIFKGASIPKMNEAACTDFEKYISMKSSNLSSTLEQLYMWEKKLYKEVKDEEKLRLFYDRKYTRLKALDNRGAESNKIDSTRAAINKLITKISMTIKSVDAISRRIHKLRDEELRPQLVELIHGLIRMWRSMLDCHQRQFQAIVEARSQKFLFKSISPQSLTAKVTADLELELMNWCSCFSNWVRAQKAYIESLNGWLMKWLHQEQEETPDGIAPFSPGRIGAPAIFVISNNWLHITERTSEDEVLSAMHAFATNLHRLCESQDEEQQQKLKAEYLSKDFARKLKALQKQNTVNEHPDAAAHKITMSASNDITDLNSGHMMRLDLMRKRLNEEKAKHREAMKQIQEVASCSLKTGLIPIFEALENYSSETLKCYNELRVPRNDT
ncbi:nitrate regulatory gene2 protein [Dendrobium catenatum]|uniref:DUF632 domain-containing protein n=1 Tax=Dendrobium catenatum TaxID=906689 RepID=A0A2I0VPJ2_9ASPA|nr:nitrate regulatory gene2 protein [Dendrobium catenatum]PKU65325.1 hypothetical protein MA16_Dca021802 [Dendrobium catenatum]